LTAARQIPLTALIVAIAGHLISEPKASRTAKPLAKESMKSGSPENRLSFMALFSGVVDISA
jgi:hypothetical protein